MPRPNPARDATDRLLARLAALRAAGEGPVPLDRLIAEACPDTPDVARRAAAGKAFAAAALVAVKGRPSAPVAPNDAAGVAALADSPLTLAEALAAAEARGKPPYPVKTLAGKLATPLRAPFAAAVAGRAAAGTLPDGVVAVPVRGGSALYRRERPPAEVALAERLAAAAGRGPTTLGRLYEAAGTFARDPLLKKALTQPAAKAVVAVKSGHPDSPVDHADRRAELLRGEPTLLFLAALLRDGRNTAHPPAKLAAKADRAVAAELKAALADAGPTAAVTFVLVNGQKHFVPVADLPAPVPDLAAAFDRVDRRAGGRNRVSLLDLRAELPGVPRAAFDAELLRLRRAGAFALREAEAELTPAERAAGVVEDGDVLLYLSRARP